MSLGDSREGRCLPCVPFRLLSFAASREIELPLLDLISVFRCWQEELRNIMTRLGDEPISDEVLDDMMAEADLNGDGQIQYDGATFTSKHLFFGLPMRICSLFCVVFPVAEFITIMHKIMDEESDCEQAGASSSSKTKSSSKRKH